MPRAALFEHLQPLIAVVPIDGTLTDFPADIDATGSIPKTRNGSWSADRRTGRPMCRRTVWQLSENSGPDADDLEVLEKPSVRDGDAFWRHRGAGR